MNTQRKIVLILCVITVTATVVYAFSYYKVGEKLIPPANGSTDVNTITLRPGDRLDIGNSYVVIHYAGYREAYTFFVTTASRSRWVYTYEVYILGRNSLFCLEGKYYMLDTISPYNAIEIHEVPPP
jgi:hypothetical protein